MATNCICYPLKYLSMSTFKDTLIGEFCASLVTISEIFHKGQLELTGFVKFYL